MKRNNIWIVGASFGGNTDMTQEFINNKIWYDGYADRGDYKNQVYWEKVNIGDILVIKSSSTKGKNHSITFTKVKAIGKIINKIEPYKFKMNWFNINDLPKDFDGISYRKTIEPIRNDGLLNFVNSILNKMEEQEIQNILLKKKQIILQGAPGTGKTRLADILAKKLTETKIITKPLWTVSP